MYPTSSVCIYKIKSEYDINGKKIQQNITSAPFDSTTEVTLTFNENFLHKVR